MIEELQYTFNGRAMEDAELQLIDHGNVSRRKLSITMKSVIVSVKTVATAEGITTHLFWMILDLHSGHSADGSQKECIGKEYD
jgi:hypothetical protein